jgi:glycosyltransferase involved in cell wall biosynthesis
MSNKEKIHVFIPTYYREPTVRICAEALLGTYRSDGYDVFLVFVDNGSNDSLRQYLSGLKDRCEYVRVILLDHNVGKSKAINDAAKQFSGFDWFINCDSDILAMTPGWPGLLVDCYKEIPRAGMVSVGYAKNGNNPMPEQPSVMNLDIRGSKYTFHYGGPVAGGCFATHVGVWDDIGYRNGGVYGGVDGLFRQHVAESLMRKCGYVDEITAEHFDDRDENSEYHRWKMDVQNCIRQFSPLADPKKLGNDKGFWDK